MTVLLWNCPKDVVDNISENSKAVVGIIGCVILLDRYIEDSHSLNDTSQAAGSSRVTSSNTFLRFSWEDLAILLHFDLTYRILSGILMMCDYGLP